MAEENLISYLLTLPARIPSFFCPHNNEDKSSSFREPFKGIQCTIGEIYCCGGEYMGMMEDNKIKSEYILWWR